jgi:hypothetical protein
MPKPHWTEAPEAIRRQIETARRNTSLRTPNGDVSVLAIGHLNALRLARRHGFAYDPIAMPAHVAVRERESVDPIEACRLRTELGFELKYESIAARESAALESWRQEPSEAEAGQARRAELRRQLDELAVEQRARAILNQAEIEREEKALTAARAKARREIETNINKGSQQ